MRTDPLTGAAIDGRGKHKQKPRVDVLDTRELDRALYRDFRDFVPDAFEVLEGGDAWAQSVRDGRNKPKFVPGWHIDAIAEHLQAVADGQIRRLLINVPPGTSKSVLACVLWPAWMWSRDPKLRWLFSSYSEEFTKRDARKTKLLVNSEWYRALFPSTAIASTPDTQMEHHTTAGGERHGASTNSGVTGKHVHGVVEDDPQKLQDATKAGAREEAWHYHSQALGFRLLPEGGWRVVVMQRLHEDDVAGRILARRGEDASDYVHLCLPMELEAKRRCMTHIVRTVGHNGSAQVVREKLFEDPRTQEGELLWPARMGAEFVVEKKKDLGSYGWAGQAQQRPAPAEGGIIKREWLRYYDKLPDKLDAWWQSWDLIFDGDGEGSYVVGQAWARAGANRYLVHQYRARVDFVETLRAFMNMAKAYPLARRKKVEKKANGAALISMLKNKVPGIVAVNPRGSKDARLMAVSPYFESGNVWFPDPRLTPWVDDAVEELVTAPNGANDDVPDTVSQALDEKDHGIGSMKLDLSVGMQEPRFKL